MLETRQRQHRQWAEEFTPDMKRLFRKLAPNKIQRIEEKLPIPSKDKP